MAFNGMFQMMNDSIRNSGLQQTGMNLQQGLMGGLGKLAHGIEGSLTGADPKQMAMRSAFDQRSPQEKQAAHGQIMQQAMASNDPTAMQVAAQKLAAEGNMQAAQVLMQKAQQMQSAKAAMGAASGRPEDMQSAAQSMLAAGDAEGAVAMAEKGGQEQKARKARSVLGEQAMKLGLEDLSQLVAEGVVSPGEAAKDIQSIKTAKTAAARAEALEKLKHKHAMEKENLDSENRIKENAAKEAAKGGTDGKGYQDGEIVKLGDKLVRVDSKNQTVIPLEETGSASGGSNPNADPNMIAQTNVAFSQYDKLMELSEEGWTSGALASNLSKMNPTGDWNTMQNMMQNMFGEASFGALQEMRDNSPTGGALGSITERELDILASQGPAGLVTPNMNPEERGKAITRATNYSVLNDMVSSYGDPVEQKLTDMNGKAYVFFEFANGTGITWPTDGSEKARIATKKGE